MKFNTSKLSLLNAEEEAQFRDAFNLDKIMEEVDQRTSELELHEYPKPSGNPSSLADQDIENMPNNVLGALYSQYMTFSMYVFTQLTKAEIAHRIGTANLKHLDARMKTRLYASDVPKAEVPAAVKDNPFYLEAELEVLKLSAIKEILGAHYKAYSKQAEALSRIISLRELDFQMQAREMGVTNKKKPGITRPVAGSKNFGAPRNKE